MALTITATCQNTLVLIDDSLGTLSAQEIDEVAVVGHRPSTARMAGIENGLKINAHELYKAACCNLGESFTTNPSVDVNYSDATTGAKQIRLLGLSGTYVQMLTEAMPNFRGAAAPYALGYVPGPWMKSIQVSKGAASVKNGYESLTGQINIEYLKPDDDPGMTVNVYGNTMGRMDANIDAGVHLTDRLSTVVLGHAENDWGNHDDNGDGFLDAAKVRQYNLQNRWHYSNERYIFHGGWGFLDEQRRGGQTEAHAAILPGVELWTTDLRTRRAEAYMKHAFILDPAHGTNIAWITSGSYHRFDARYGHDTYDVGERNLYSQLMLEHNFNHEHNLSTGVNLNHDYYTDVEKETVAGAYAQYTYNMHEKVIAMAGLRVDHSDVFGTFVTPRFHLKWQPITLIGLRASVGKGYRSVHPLAEYNYLLGSGRELIIDPLSQEEAWNSGVSASLSIPISDKLLKVNAEYYFTDFMHQTVIDYDSNPGQIHIANLDGKSFSHTYQVDASMDVVRGLNVLMAYRRNHVKETLGGILRDKPLQSRYKGLLTLSYKTPLELWQFDATLQLNGGGRMPTPYLLPDGTQSWAPTFGAWEQLNVQVTRWFRHFSIYAGGENLTNRRQPHPIIAPDNPWGTTFDPTLIYGSTTGAMGFVGIRVNIGRL